LQSNIREGVFFIENKTLFLCVVRVIEPTHVEVESAALKTTHAQRCVESTFSCATALAIHTL